MYIASLGNVCRWLGQQAEALGVEIYPGFAAAEILYDDNGAVRGVATGDMGVAKDGSHKGEYQPGMELHAKYTLFAEGCRGSLSQELMQRVQPARRRRSAEVRHRPQGAVAARAGQAPEGARAAQPGLAARHEDRRRLVRLSLRRRPGRPSGSSSTSTTRTRTSRRTTNSSASRRIRRSAACSRAASGSRYGARAINEGGLQSVPKLAFPGGALIGCAAGFVNLPRIKGTHNAMKTGMLGAEAAFAARRGRAAARRARDVRRRPSASHGCTRISTRCAT